MLICLVIKTLNPVVTELFIRRRKLNIPLVFFTQFYLVVPKIVRLTSTNYVIMKILNKRGLQQMAFNHSSVTDFKDFMNLHKKFTAKSHLFSIVDATLTLDNTLHFRKNLLEKYIS